MSKHSNKALSLLLALVLVLALLPTAALAATNGHTRDEAVPRRGNRQKIRGITTAYMGRSALISSCGITDI